MNIDQIQYIVEIAKTKSLIAAANNLYITQSALSQSISNLEAELGIKIFTRSRNGTIPTANGKFVIKKAIEILTKLQEIKDEAQACSNILNSELRVESIPIGMASLVRAVSHFKQDYPHTKFQITQNNSSVILQDLREKKSDLGLIAIKKGHLTHLHEFIFEPLTEGKIVVGVGKNHPLAKKNSISSQELLKHPIVLYEEKHVQEFIQEFEKKVGSLQAMFTTNNSAAILTTLHEGLGITFGYDISFLHASIFENDVIPIEISDFEQEPIIFGWIQLKNTEKSLVSKQFKKRFMNNFIFPTLG
ncbi:LysR family transcriptional regulator [Solibacillus sp. R5-41]|uniref:LysR family transcriptional regulator n=1 Tax=Solibacillus sp. R5-41 TaxID=2048654 RepID=UPI000C128B26|nr:LysR family transcriptional regulator [Solibacillus sp. R5-41]ATP41640.1 LysR family transcriptional regulator [Solibacillus sp. R5-41]